MKDFEIPPLALICVAIALLASGLVIGAFVQQHQDQALAVTAGKAEYIPDTDGSPKFHWKQP